MKSLIVLTVFLLACSPESLKQQQKESIDYGMNTLEYCKDTRTGLCFAGCNLGWQTSVLANVPCTPEVERLIK